MRASGGVPLSAASRTVHSQVSGQPWRHASEVNRAGDSSPSGPLLPRRIIGPVVERGWRAGKRAAGIANLGEVVARRREAERASLLQPIRRVGVVSVAAGAQDAELTARPARSLIAEIGLHDLEVGTGRGTSLRAALLPERQPLPRMLIAETTGGADRREDDRPDRYVCEMALPSGQPAGELRRIERRQRRRAGGSIDQA